MEINNSSQIEMNKPSSQQMEHITALQTLISKNPHYQIGAVFYANAIATAIRATEKQIPGRVPPPHSELVRALVDQYGHQGDKLKFIT